MVLVNIQELIFGILKTKNILDIPKLEDAKWAGTKRKSNQCTLILTEGDSAKAMAIAGISVLEEGRNKYGIFPLKGKLLNVRDKLDKDIESYNFWNKYLAAVYIKSCLLIF